MGGDVYSIFLRDYVTSASVGVYDHEKQRRQKIRVSVDLSARHPGAGFADDITAVVSYEEIVAIICRLAKGPHIVLIETLADRIAAACLDDERVMRARVQVEKLEVFPDAASVGVVLERCNVRHDIGLCISSKNISSKNLN
ncbi:7,8-dihydroneopterin aldolase/epimerase/oxygenase [Azospirillaceae bacterium]